MALLSRYHRKSAPKLSHPEFAALSAADQALVTRWVGILRVADGLDRSHAGAARVTGLTRTRDGWQLGVQGPRRWIWRVRVRRRTCGPARSAR